MTTPSPLSRRRPVAGIPRGEVLAQVDSYDAAQSVVNRLAHAGFSLTEISIVGRDLVTIERVTGRLTYARVALRGALNGSWFGLFFGIMVSLGQTEGMSVALPAAVAIGAGVGMLLQLALYSIRRRQHDFSSVQQVVASRYEVLVPGGSLARAQSALASAPRENG